MVEVTSGEIAILRSIQNLEKKIGEKSDLPAFYALTLDQAENLLRRTGYFAKEEPGLQDNFDQALRTFYRTSERGDLIPGLAAADGRTITLSELYTTMDLRGIIWNYGLGWLSAFKGGWNISMNEAEKQAEEKIKYIRKNSDPTIGISALYQYLNAKKQLADLGRFQWDDKTESWEYVSEPPKTKRSVLSILKRDEKNEIVRDKNGNPILEPWGVQESTDNHPYTWGPFGYGAYGGIYPEFKSGKLEEIKQFRFKR